ncbi:uncharacterized protein [Hetaerina americana]|uniref:uncharacterized protein n=1 Tax=Hetaerina americana TaxID=62018 RepID=UPI003A7F5C91
MLSPASRKLKLCQTTIALMVWITYASTYLSRKPLGVIKSSIKNELKFTNMQLGWLDSAILLPYSVFQIVLGPVADRLGPKITISSCLFLSGSAMVTFGSWSNYYMLFFLLFLSGTAQGPCWPSCSKFLSSWFADANLHSIFGAVSTSAFGGSIVASGVAVYLMKNYGWRFVYFPTSLYLLLLSFVAFFSFKTPMEYGMVVPGKEILPEKSRTGSSRQHQLRELWQIPTVAELSVAMACMKLVRYTMYLWLPVYLVQSLNYSTADAGMYSIVFDIGGVLGSIILGIAADRVASTESYRALLHIWMASVSATISFILFSLTASWGVSYNTMFMMAAGAFICGPDGLLGGSVAISVGESGGRNAGAAVTGLINGFGSFGAVIEGPLVAFIAEKFSWDAVFLLMIFLSSLGSFAIMRAFAMQRRTSRINALLVEDSV